MRDTSDHSEQELAKIRARLVVVMAELTARGMSANVVEVYRQIEAAYFRPPNLWKVARDLKERHWFNARKRRNARRIQRALRMHLDRVSQPQFKDDMRSWLTSTLCILDFGVGANFRWYSRFTDLVHNGRIKRHQLEALLATSGVVCDDGGELLIEWPTRSKIVATSICIGVLVCAAALANSVVISSIELRRGLPLLLASNCLLGFVAIGLWRMGPGSFNALRKLSRLGVTEPMDKHVVIRTS